MNINFDIVSAVLLVAILISNVIVGVRVIWTNKVRLDNMDKTVNGDGEGLATRVNELNSDRAEIKTEIKNLNKTLNDGLIAKVDRIDQAVSEIKGKLESSGR